MRLKARSLAALLGGALLASSTGLTAQTGDSPILDPLGSATLFPTPLPQIKPPPPPPPPAPTPGAKPNSLFGLPTPLSADQAQIYQAIFANLKLGRFGTAGQLRAELSDDSLMGYVLAETYLNPAAPLPDGDDLALFMTLHGSVAKADQVYDLSLTLGEASVAEAIGSSASLKYPALEVPGRYASKSVASDDDRTALNAQIKTLKIADDYTAALELVNSPDAALILDPTERDRARADIAAEIYFEGGLESFRSAYDLASKSAARNGKFAPRANWIAGLSAWRLGQAETAQKHFANCADSIYWLSHDRAACAFWAGRAAAKVGGRKEAIKQFEKALTYPNTLYGLLASLRLSEEPKTVFDLPTMTPAQLKLLSSEQPFQRIAALIQIGQYRLAELDLLDMARRESIPLRQALRALARRVGLPELALRLGHFASTKDEQSDYNYEELYPTPVYQPDGGFLVDRALVLAIAREESGFRADSESDTGSLGLMHLLVGTADFLVNSGYVAPYGRPRDLKRPEVNLSYGDVYVAYLLNRPDVQRNVIDMLIAYNAGYENLEAWKNQAQDAGDQLMLIESLPSEDTRDYVDRVLRSYLLYRAKFDQTFSDFKNLAKGGALLYVPRDRIGSLPD